MLRLSILLTCLCLPNLAYAAHTFSTEEKLLGWSADGSTWAVLSTSMGYATIRVMRRGKLVLEVCNQAEPDAQNPDSCVKGRNMVVVNVSPTKKHTGLERINIETHNALKQFKLQAVSASWRTEFKKRFTFRYGPYGLSPFSKRCAAGWTLTRKADKKAIKRARTKYGCLTARGGYLSSKGKHLLIKTESLTQPPQKPGEESGDTFETSTYVWIEL